MTGEEALFDLSEGLAENLAPLLTSPSPQARVFGRLIATGISRTLEDFLQAEDARGTPRELMVTAVLNHAANVVASILLPIGTADAKALEDITETVALLFSHSLGRCLGRVAAHRLGTAGNQPPPTGVAS